MPPLSRGKARAAHDGKNCHDEGTGQRKSAPERAPEISKDHTTAESRPVRVGLNAAAIRDDMAEAKDLELICAIARQGGRKYTAGNIDRQKYQRLVDLGWLTATPTAISDVVYEVTVAGKEVAAAPAEAEG